MGARQTPFTATLRAWAVGCALVGLTAVARADTGTPVDSDGDGLADVDELAQGSDPLDADSDDDGLLDGADPGPRACDTDRDGVLDGTEAGVVTPHPDTDVAAGCFVADADPLTTTDPADADSDDGGLSDGGEDRDGDGAVGPWETDPSDGGDDVDSDDDGFPDAVEGTGDLDMDGLPDFLDPDSDGDGLLDRLEGIADPDGDGPAFRDADADDDGLADGVEGTSDPDGDGMPCHVDADCDGNGIEDGVEGTGDFDDDDIPDFRDLDDDGDRRPDVDEAGRDLDCDGRDDRLDPIADDGFCDSGLGRPEVDDAPFDSPFEAPEPPAPARLGGGCATGVGAPWLALLALGLARRRRGGRAAWVAAAIVAGSSGTPAHAQEGLDAARLRPVADSDRFVAVTDAAIGRPLTAGGALFVAHAHAPFVQRVDTEDGPVTRALVASVTTLHLLPHAVASRRVRFAADLPLHLGADVAPGAPRVLLGDVRFGIKVRPWWSDPDGKAPAHLALTADLSLPTGASWAFLGARTAVLDARVAARVQPVEALTLAAHAGLRTGTGARVGAYVDGPAALLGAGVSVRVRRGLALAAEADGAVALRRGTGGAPLELLGTARFGRGGLQLVAGGGGGVTQGVGGAQWRVVAGLSALPGWGEPAKRRARRGDVPPQESSELSVPAEVSDATAAPSESPAPSTGAAPDEQAGVAAPDSGTRESAETPAASPGVGDEAGSGPVEAPHGSAEPASDEAVPATP